MRTGRQQGGTIDELGFPEIPVWQYHTFNGYHTSRIFAKLFQVLFRAG